MHRSQWSALRVSEKPARGPVFRNERANGRSTRIRRFIRQRLQRHDSVSVCLTRTIPADKRVAEFTLPRLTSVPVRTRLPSVRSSLTKPRGSFACPTVFRVWFVVWRISGNNLGYPAAPDHPDGFVGHPVKHGGNEVINGHASSGFLTPASEMRIRPAIRSCSAGTLRICRSQIKEKGL
jgi:hypothetical protein